MEKEGSDNRENNETPPSPSGHKHGAEQTTPLSAKLGGGESGQRYPGYAGSKRSYS